MMNFNHKSFLGLSKGRCILELFLVETNLPKKQCAPVAAIKGQKRPQTQSQSFSLEIRHECKGGLNSECILNFQIVLNFNLAKSRLKS